MTSAPVGAKLSRIEIIADFLAVLCRLIQFLRFGSRLSSGIKPIDQFSGSFEPANHAIHLQLSRVVG